jgi:hypothetical protein
MFSFLVEDASGIKVKVVGVSGTRGTKVKVVDRKWN